MVVPCHPVGSAAALRDVLHDAPRWRCAVRFTRLRLDGCGGAGSIAAGPIGQGHAMSSRRPGRTTTGTTTAWHRSDRHRGELAARLDRLPMTRHIWYLVTLISLGGCFELYDLFLTAYIAPGLNRAGYFTPDSLGVFNVLGPLRGGRHRHLRVRPVRRPVRRRDLPRPRRRPLRQAHRLHLLAGLVFDHHRDHGVPDLGLRASISGASSPASASASSW